MGSIRYANTRGDLLVFSALHHLRSRWTWLGLAASVLLSLPAVIAAAPWERGPVVGTVTAVVFELLIVAFLTALMVAAIALTVAFAHGPGLFTEHVVSFDEHGVTERTEFNASTVVWRAVHNVVRAGDHHIFIYIAPTMAHLIPRRAVASDEDWDALSRQLQEHCQRARVRQAA